MSTTTGVAFSCTSALDKDVYWQFAYFTDWLTHHASSSNLFLYCLNCWERSDLSSFKDLSFWSANLYVFSYLRRSNLTVSPVPSIHSSRADLICTSASPQVILQHDNVEEIHTAVIARAIVGKGIRGLNSWKQIPPSDPSPWNQVFNMTYFMPGCSKRCVSPS